MQDCNSIAGHSSAVNIRVILTQLSISILRADTASGNGGPQAPIACRGRVANGRSIEPSTEAVRHYRRSCADAEYALREQVHDVIVLDRQLTDSDGISLLTYLRSINMSIPVIVLTALGSVPDRVTGLNMGADNYLAKPFAVEELFARLRALLRRLSAIAPLIATVGKLSSTLIIVKPLLMVLSGLPRRELLVLETLDRRQGRTVLRGALEEAVYGSDDEIQSNALDSHVSRLRKKLRTLEPTLRSMRYAESVICCDVLHETIYPQFAERKLIRQLLLFQAVLLFLFILALVALLVRVDLGGALVGT